ELIQRARHAGGQRGVDRVSHLRAIERDQQDVPAALSEDGLGEDGGLFGAHRGAEATLTRSPRRSGLIALLLLAARGVRRALELGATLGPRLERRAKLADAVAERAREARQSLGPEHDKRDDGDEQQVYGIPDAHPRTN